jgi:hypothetical protein
LGLTQNANFSVTIEPVSDNIQSAQTDPLIFENMNILDRLPGEFSIVLNANINSGDKVVFDLCINNGTLTQKFRFTKIFGVFEILCEDDCETMDKWSSTTWGITTLKYVSPTHSIADSPYGPYPNNANTSIYSKNSYDLTSAIAAFAEFEAQWDIEAGYDYVQFLVSVNNGTTWVPQHGKYTKLGNNYQDYGKPLYDGTQSSWVKETIDLSGYVWKNIKLGFRLKSDGWVNKDGFYFDDFVFGAIFPQHLLILALPDTISFPDTLLCYEFNIMDYVTTNHPEELSVRWEGNEHLKITYNEETSHILICAEGWTGCENVTFFVENPYNESNQMVVIQCTETIIDNINENALVGFIVNYNSTTKKIEIHNLKKESTFSLYNMEGKQLYSFNVNNNNFEINVSGFSSGVYFLKTNFGEVKKIVIY